MIEKIGSDLWIDMSPGEEIRLRNGASLSWFGELDDVIATDARAKGSGIGKRSVGMPIMQKSLVSKTSTRLLAKFGSKYDVWAISLDGESPFFFRGKFYLGQRGPLTFEVKRLSLDHFLFLVQPKGKGMLYLALPKDLTQIALEGRTLTTTTDNIAMIPGEADLRKLSSKEELKMMFRKGGWKSFDFGQLSGVEHIWLHGGEVEQPFSLFGSGDDS